MASNTPVTLETLITVKVAIQGANRKFKIPLKDLSANVLLGKLRTLLQIPDGDVVIFERFSDSAGTYVVLDPANTQVFKTLYRAAKAKLKLRLRATLPNAPEKPAATPKESSSIPPAFPRMARPVSMSVLNMPSGSLGSAMSSTTTLNDAASITKARLLRQIAAAASQMNLNEKAANAAARSATGRESAEPARPFIDEASSRDAAIAFLRGRPSPKKPEMPEQTLPVRSKEGFTNLAALKEALPALPLQAASWSVYCNACDKVMVNEHYHCSVCDEGDYDLCIACVDAGVHCPGKDHWLVKRFVKQGNVVSSTTERVGPKKAATGEPRSPVKRRESQPQHEMPGAFKEEKKTDEVPMPTRTCNSCVREFPENEFVHCQQCEDYDLCIGCHVESKHGHHPGHAFERATRDTIVGPLAEILCAPGRNVRHQAICDGCDKYIFGVRHKCLDCPDWDFCWQCAKSASVIHPSHRIVPLYDPIDEAHYTTKQYHHGIFCDGPLCRDNQKQQYIRGVRYKCAVCNDTDFCGNCEASPLNKHNSTHPLIKLKTPIRNVFVTTMNEDHKTATRRTLGDINRPVSLVSEKSAQEKSPVKTIMDIKPVVDAPPKPAKEKIEIKDLLADPIEEKVGTDNLLLASNTMMKPLVALPAQAAKREQRAMADPGYDAIYVRDTMADGTKITPGQRFTQIWILRNPGPKEWPAGCSVKFTGGDHMLNIDPVFKDTHATQSSVIRRPVKVGEEVAFSIVMKAPERTGHAISYWRLKSPEGVPFGHRLWCHVEVIPRNPFVEDAPESPPAVPAIPASKTFDRPHSVIEVSSAHPPTASIQGPAISPVRFPPRPVSMMPMVPPFPPNAPRVHGSGHVTASPPVPMPFLPPTQQMHSHSNEIKHENVNKGSPSNLIDLVNTRYTYVPYRPGAMPSPPAVKTNNQLAFQDYQMQMMLLEQQNRQRLLIARQEAERSAIEAKEAANKGKGPALWDPPVASTPLDKEKIDELKAQRKENLRRLLNERKEQIKRSQEALSHNRARARSDAFHKARNSLTSKPDTQISTPSELEKSTQPSTVVPAQEVEAAALNQVNLPETLSPTPEIKRVDSNKTTSSNTEASTMIFPTLEKESPTSSMSEAAVTAPSSVKKASITPASPSTVKSEPELFEDAESVDLSDASFLTDEEYDILDASDEDAL